MLCIVELSSKAVVLTMPRSSLTYTKQGEHISDSSIDVGSTAAMRKRGR